MIRDKHLAAVLALCITPVWAQHTAAGPARTAAVQTSSAWPGVAANTDLVKLTELDPRIVLDIRYATPNNFVHRAVYDRATAYLQRPAAEALKRVNDKLGRQGLGLVVFDGYRPLSVTRIFWEVTPEDKKMYVADPAIGSRHNRGCAVDLSLIDVATRRPVPMPSDFDNFTDHAWHSYSGGTAESRKNREILKTTMESEGFLPNSTEWWHYDYKDWHDYPVLDISFEDLEGAKVKKAGPAK